MNVTKLIFALGLVVALSAPAWSQQRPENSELVARLEEMQSKNDWRITTRGGAKGVLLMHRAKLTRIIDDLKAGKSVDPKEIDALLREHEQVK